MKIAFVFDGLGYGGIERVGLDYIKILTDAGHDIDVFNLNIKAEEMVPQLPRGIKYKRQKFALKLCPDLYSYGVKKSWWGKFAYPILYIMTSLTFPIRKLLIRKREKYDLAIAFAGHFRDLTFVGNNFVKADKKLCWLHGSLAEYLLIASGYGDLYKKINNLIVLSSDSQYAALNGNKFLSNLCINKIYNPTFILEKGIDNLLVSELKDKYGEFILNVARFERQKDQKTIIKSIKLLKSQGILNKVVFVGDGSMLDECKAMAKTLDVEDQCIFEGSKGNVQDFYKACSIFVHSSPAEGLPTVLIEAMCFGKPIIASNSPPGVQEILQDGRYGIVVPIADELQFAEKIKLLMRNNDKYDEYSAKALERSQDFLPKFKSMEILKLIQKL